jgi:hypothetical protein
MRSQTPVVHTCNPSYLRRLRSGGLWFKVKKSKTLPISKITTGKRAGGVAQVGRAPI